MLSYFFLRYLYLSASPFWQTLYPTLYIKVLKHISIQFLHLNVLLYLNSSGFHLLYCMLVTCLLITGTQEVFEHRSFIAVDLSPVTFIFSVASILPLKYRIPSFWNEIFCYEFFNFWSWLLEERVFRSTDLFITQYTKFA